jgi:SOS response regulatory protein OraA/RecX
MPSRYELEKKLVGEKGVSPQEASSVLTYLTEIGLHSDAAVAEVLVRSRWNQQRKSLAVISKELLQIKKIDKTVADEAINNFFGSRDMQGRDIRDAVRNGSQREMEEEEEEERSVVMGGELLATARRRVESMQGDPESKRRKLSGWLMRRGHRWEVIGPILEALFVK